MVNDTPANCILWGTTGACAYEAAAPQKNSAAAKNLMLAKVKKNGGCAMIDQDLSEVHLSANFIKLNLLSQSIRLRLQKVKATMERDVKADIVSGKKYILYRFLRFLLMPVFPIAHVIVGSNYRGRGIIETSHNEFIKNNRELLENISFWIGLGGLFLDLVFSFQKELGFLKINDVRLNVDGAIFYWTDVQSVSFTIKSPKVFGFRSFRYGFGNWIECVHKGHLHKYEFRIETQVMEDMVLEIINDVTTKSGKAKIKIVSAKTPWYLKLLEELGLDPQ
jgi:hypothetical protein